MCSYCCNDPRLQSNLPSVYSYCQPHRTTEFKIMYSLIIKLKVFECAVLLGCDDVSLVSNCGCFEGAKCCKMPGTTHQMTEHYLPEEPNTQLHCYENHKSHLKRFIRSWSSPLKWAPNCQPDLWLATVLQCYSYHPPNFASTDFHLFGPLKKHLVSKILETDADVKQLAT